LAASYFNRGLIYKKRGDSVRAESDFAEASRLDPRIKRTNTSQQDDLTPALVAQSTSGAPASLRGQDTATQSAKSSCIKETGDRAIAACDDAIKQDPKDDRFYSARGRALASKREFDKAIADFSEVIKLGAASSSTFAARGSAWLSKRDYNKAIADYDEAIKSAPQASFYGNRGSAWAYKDEPDKAIDDFNEAIRLNPHYSRAYSFRGWMWQKKGEDSKAIADLDEAIKLNPQDSTAYNNRCNFYRRKLEFAKAVRDCNEAIKTDRKNAWALDSRGDLWKDMKNYEAAIIDYTAALKEDPNHIPTYFNLGFVYESKGEVAKAVEFYKQYNALDPSDSRAIEALARLNLSQTNEIVIPALENEKLKLPNANVTVQVRRVALVIGNGKYQSQSPLTNPANDALLLATSFRAAGFQTVIVKADQSREQLITSIREFAALADSADWAVIYYSGHGIEYNGINYMIPVDARLKVDRDIELEAVDVEKITTAMEGAKRLRLLILDSCRTNPFIGGMRRTVATRSIERGLAPMEPEAGTLVVFAAKHGQEALDGEGKNGPFASALAKRIQTPNLDVRRLFDLVRDDVMARTNGKQQPFSYGSLSGSEDFYFVQR
jgi:tetratricopeptide (TPR) repeat protein